MQTIFNIIAIALELFWIIGLILCIKDDIYWEEWGTYTVVMIIANILAITILLKYY